MKYCFLVENKTENAECMAEHGLSIYIETGSKKILLDAGTSNLLIKNAEAKGIDLSQIDFAVISHGHFDHIGGFPEFCRKNRHAPIYLHKNALRKTHRCIRGQMEARIWGMSWSESEYESMRDRIIPMDGRLYVSENICITGTVPFADGDAMEEAFYYTDEEGKLAADDMSHEQCLVIKEPEGLYIFSGCSHRGAVSALRAGEACFPGTKTAAFIAGMHLFNSDDAKIASVLSRLKEKPPEKIIPVHCTGVRALCKCMETFGDRCVIAMTGDWFEGIKKI